MAVDSQPVPPARADPAAGLTRDAVRRWRCPGSGSRLALPLACHDAYESGSVGLADAHRASDLGGREPLRSQRRGPWQAAPAVHEADFYGTLRTEVGIDLTTRLAAGLPFNSSMSTARVGLSVRFRHLSRIRTWSVRILIYPYKAPEALKGSRVDPRHLPASPDGPSRPHREAAVARRPGRLRGSKGTTAGRVRSLHPG